MNHLDPLISDLALILMLAGITTLLFKWGYSVNVPKNQDGI